MDAASFTTQRLSVKTDSPGSHAWHFCPTWTDSTLNMSKQFPACAEYFVLDPFLENHCSIALSLNKTNPPVCLVTQITVEDLIQSPLGSLLLPAMGEEEQVI